ncbi:hypothetical protein LUZ60_003828 [Juncus effusus]|nr:hypothetical protein LUZ60_003828 [Juncus effusus]
MKKGKKSKELSSVQFREASTAQTLPDPSRHRMAALHLRLRHMWRRYGGVVAVSAVVGLALLFLSLATRSPELGRSGSDPVLVDLTVVEDAEEKGALCLDGTLPGYHFLSGFGSGSNNWIVHIEGGGWCRNLEKCTSRKYTNLGSSNKMESQVPFIGILSNIPSQNPDFYNWNKVMIRYCDGASFSGDVENVEQNGEKLFFRGQRIWEAIMDELLKKGLINAKQALLTGCSAGGLATYIHCDNFRNILPNSVKVKCMADGGFFLNTKDISGKNTMQDFYNDVVQLQQLGKRFPNCISKSDPAKCFFPEEIIKNISTPVFILNPAYDAWQVQHVLAPDVSDPKNSWQNCKLDLSKCDSDQLKILQGFRGKLLDDLKEVKKKKDWGIFVNSCFVHCQSMKNFTWHSPNSPRINNRTIGEAVGDWYFERREVKEIDCEYPCNPTCFNMVFAKPYKT